jgi:hypothetical protein
MYHTKFGHADVIFLLIQKFGEEIDILPLLSYPTQADCCAAAFSFALFLGSALLVPIWGLVVTHCHIPIWGLLIILLRTQQHSHESHLP